MAKKTIKVSLEGNELIYTDSDGQTGPSIKTKAKDGTRIVWTLDKKSGIKDLCGIKITGACNFFSKGPIKKSCDKWIAVIASKATGEVDYELFITPENDVKKSKVTTSAKSTAKDGDPDPPKITIEI